MANATYIPIENLSGVIISTVPISDLIKMIADEIDRRALLKLAPSNDIPPPEPKRLYGDKSAADHIGCTDQAVGKLRKADKIRFYTLGTRY